MPEIRLTNFVIAPLPPMTNYAMQINVLPGTEWRVTLIGPGHITKDELEIILSDALRPHCNGDYTRLQGSQANFTIDLTTMSIRGGQIEFQRDRTGGYTGFTGYRPRAPEELLVTDVARAEERAHQEEDRRQAVRRRELVKEKASATLNRMLDEDQRQSLKSRGYFMITGSKGTPYRVETDNYSGNIKWVEGDEVRGVYCAHPRLFASDLQGNEGELPILDSVIAQKLMLETDEEAFMQIANLFGGTYPPVVERSERSPFRGLVMPGPGCECPACRRMYGT